MSRNRTCQTVGIAALGPDLHPDTADRVEVPEIEDILARLAVDPQDGRLDRDAPDDGPQPLGGGMQRRPRHDRAEREQHHARSAPAHIGVEFERPRHHRRRQRAAAAVTDDQDFVGFVGAGNGHEPAGAGLDRGIERGRRAARESAQIGPVAVDLDDEPSVGQPVEGGGRSQS